MTCPCGAKTHAGTYLCDKCVKKLDRLLADVNAHYGELANLRLGYDRFGSGGTRPIGEAMPLIVDLRFVQPSSSDLASEWDVPGREGQATIAIRATHGILRLAGRLLLAEHTPLPGPVCAMCLHTSCAHVRRNRIPQPTVQSVTAYLHGHLTTIRARHWAPAFLEGLTDVERHLRTLIDRPGDRWYAGTCDCGKHLYAKAGAPVVQCRACAASYDVAVRRDYMLDVAEDYIATATELARAVTWLGAKPLTADRIRQWAARGRITRRATDHCSRYGKPGHADPCRRCQPLYRIGDAIDLLAEDTNERKHA